MTRELVTTGDEACDNANFPVVLGLGQGVVNETIVEALIALLRSDHYIQPMVRDALADALALEHPSLKLVLSRSKTGPAPDEFPMLRAMRKTVRRLEVGRYIVEHPYFEAKVESAIQAARDEFGVSRDEAYRSLASWRDALDLQSGD